MAAKHDAAIQKSTATKFFFAFVLGCYHDIKFGATFKAPGVLIWDNMVTFIMIHILFFHPLAVGLALVIITVIIHGVNKTTSMVIITKYIITPKL